MMIIRYTLEARWWLRIEMNPCILRDKTRKEMRRKYFVLRNNSIFCTVRVKSTDFLFASVLQVPVSFSLYWNNNRNTTRKKITILSAPLTLIIRATEKETRTDRIKAKGECQLKTIEKSRAKGFIHPQCISSCCCTSTSQPEMNYSWTDTRHIS